MNEQVVQSLGCRGQMPQGSGGKGDPARTQGHLLTKCPWVSSTMADPQHWVDIMKLSVTGGGGLQLPPPHCGKKLRRARWLGWSSRLFPDTKAPGKGYTRGRAGEASPEPGALPCRVVRPRASHCGPLSTKGRVLVLPLHMLLLPSNAPAYHHLHRGISNIASSKGPSLGPAG